MEEGDVQLSISATRTTSSEGADIDLDALDLLPLSGDNAWLEVAINASSSPSFFASPSSFFSDATTTTATPATANTFWSQPSTGVARTTASEGSDIDIDALDFSDNACLEVATDASSPSSFFASSSTFLISDATSFTASANTCLIQPTISAAHTTSYEGAAVDLEQLLSNDNAWLEAATASNIPRSLNSFASPSTFLSDVASTRGTPARANTCLIQPVPRPTSSEGGWAVDLDLLEHLLSGDNSWHEVATNASRSPNLLTSPSTFPSDTPARSNTCLIQSTGASSSVRDRFKQVLAYIREKQRDADVLVQLWAPVKSSDGQLVLTMTGQPFTLDHSSDSLIRFREVSTQYQFSADVASESPPVGLPGRVFIGKIPEWSPDVRYFTSYEWPMVNHAQYLDVHGTIGLPVFEKGNYSCLGVLELLTTRQKLNFTSELDTICSALQAVNLRTTKVSSIPRTKFNSASYKDAIPEILQVLRATCIIHELPLAQTWVACAQQGKRGSRHSDENYRYCISTIDAACYVNEPRMQSFHVACSEHHLLRGQGVAGKASITNQPCFLPDIGSSTKLEYPLSHYAKIFNLKGAVAIRLRCTRTGTADFVLEFFLPTDCEVPEEQKAVLDSLSGTMRSVCQTLRVVTDKELEHDAMMEMNELNSLGPQEKKAKRRKPMARRSPVWKSFTEIKVGDSVKAKCNHCGLELSCDSKNGTSSLRSHLKRWCKRNPNRNKDHI